MGFVRPDLVSRCTWKPNETKPDHQKGTQGPHTIDKSKDRMKIMPDVLGNLTKPNQTIKRVLRDRILLINP